MLFLELFIACLLGVSAGIITGLIPGIHINLISILLVSLSAYFLGFTDPVVLGVFIIAMAVTHTFLDSIPSIFLGAPDADMVMSVLPGHQLLLEGRGYEAVKLTVIGSFFSLLLVILIMPLLIPFVPLIYSFLEPYIGYILIFVVLFMILKENGLDNKFWSFYLFFLSGILGLLVLNMPNLSQPLFPMLSGLFGVSTLIVSLSQNVEVPKQRVTEMIHVSLGKKLRALGAAVFSGSLTGIFPGLGAAQASIIGMQLVGNIGNYGFMILIGGINTVNFVFSLATFYTLQKARNGAIVAVMEIVRSISLNELIVFLAAALIAGSIAAFLALLFARVFSKLIGLVNYKMVCMLIIGLISILSFVFGGILGLVVLVTSTFIGMLAPLIGVKRSHAMGCLLLPVILFFIL